MKPSLLALILLGLTSSGTAQQPISRSPKVTAKTEPSHSQTCTDITNLDVRNTTLQVAGRTFVFHNGVAKKGPLESVPNGNEKELRHEWKAAIEQDTVVRPAPDTTIRFLLIDDSHETGSGWRFYLVGFRCYEGQLQQVFSKQGLTLKIDHLDASGVTIRRVEQGNTAPTVVTYVWNGKQYKLRKLPAN